MAARGVGVGVDVKVGVGVGVAVGVLVGVGVGVGVKVAVGLGVGVGVKVGVGLGVAVGVLVGVGVGVGVGVSSGSVVASSVSPLLSPRGLCATRVILYLVPGLKPVISYDVSVFGNFWRTRIAPISSLIQLNSNPWTGRRAVPVPSFGAVHEPVMLVLAAVGFSRSGGNGTRNL